MNQYFAFGYVLGSNKKLPLPEYTGTRHYDLMINMEEKEKSVTQDFQKSTSFVIGDNNETTVAICYENETQTWICYQGICDFQIDKKNNRIDCFFHNAENLEIATLYLLSDAITTWLRSVKQYVFHAASVHINGQNIMLCADKGVGKSTLLIALCNCGGRVISDDLSSVSEVDGNIVIRSSFPYIKLNSRQFGLAKGIIGSFEPVIKGSTKRNCTLLPNTFYRGEHKLDCVYILHAVDSKHPIYISKLNKMDAFVELLKSVFSGTTASSHEMVHYQNLIRKIINENKVYKIDIPRNLMLLPKIVEVVSHYTE